MSYHFFVLLVAVIVVSNNVLLGATTKDVTAADAETLPKQADQDGKIAVENARLASPNKSECAAAVKSLVKIGKPAVPALIKVLGDSRNDVRAYAAEAIRPIIDADPASAPNCHEKEFWEQRIAKLKAGMTLEEALKLLLPDLSHAERLKTFQGSFSGGGGSTSIVRLDDYWEIVIYSFDERPKQTPKADRDGLQLDPNTDLLGEKSTALPNYPRTVQYDYNTRLERGKLSPDPPVLERRVRHVWVESPAAYTGPWTTWYVNGQKAHEGQYENGRRDGTSTSFFDDGSKSLEQHYTMDICQGTDTGWHRNGKKSYEGQYENDEQVGVWRWWNENGQIISTKEYEAGKEVEKADK